MVFFVLVLAMILVMGAITVYIGKNAFGPPRNRPEQFLKTSQSNTRPVVVCLGDSITHGHVSHSDVDMLEKTLSQQDTAVVNAGINGDLAYNLYSRFLFHLRAIFRDSSRRANIGAFLYPWRSWLARSSIRGKSGARCQRIC